MSRALANLQTVTLSEVTRRRLQNERLIGAPFERPEEVLQWLGAVQAQDYPGAKWGIGQRVKGCVDADVEQAYISGRILRTHVMRPTWHFVAAEDLRWLLELTAPRVHLALGSAYRRLGLSEADFARGHEAIEAALQAGEPLVKQEMVAVLERAGLEGERLRLHHVIMHAELEGLICSGPRRGRQQTHVLLADRAPDAKRLDRDEALPGLARRYFAGHAPATARDFAWWSGLTLVEARRAIELADLGAGDDGWYGLDGIEPDGAGPKALLVGMFDESVIAYQDLRFAFAPPPDGLEPLIRPIVIDGRTVGTWRRVTERGSVTVEARPFEPLGAAEREALVDAASRFGGFLGTEARLAIV
jgi:DNA glycosylase AlkZ-like